MTDSTERANEESTKKHEERAKADGERQQMIIEEDRKRQEEMRIEDERRQQDLKAQENRRREEELRREDDRRQQEYREHEAKQAEQNMSGKLHETTEQTIQGKDRNKEKAEQEKIPQSQELRDLANTHDKYVRLIKSGYYDEKRAELREAKEREQAAHEQQKENVSPAMQKYLEKQQEMKTEVQERLEKKEAQEIGHER